MTLQLSDQRTHSIISAMIGVEQGPKSNSHRGIIFEAYTSRKPYAKILTDYGLTNAQGVSATYGLINAGYVPKSTKDALYQWRYGGIGSGQRVLNPAIDPHRLQISERKGGETAQMFPLLIRSFKLDEIWGITHYSISQMHNVLSYLRGEQGVLARPTQEESNHTRLQTKRIRRILAGDESLTADEEKSFALAGEFLRTKLVSTELDSWKGLYQLYELGHRRLPRLSANRLRLEVFFKARMQAASGDTRLLLLYKDIGDRVDLEWFDRYLGREEEFITEVLESGMPYHVDERGVFQQDDKGNRWRPIDVVDGKLVIAGLSENRLRRLSREWRPS